MCSLCSLYVGHDVPAGRGIDPTLLIALILRAPTSPRKVTSLSLSEGFCSELRMSVSQPKVSPCCLTHYIYLTHCANF